MFLLCMCKFVLHNLFSCHIGIMLKKIWMLLNSKETTNFKRKNMCIFMVNSNIIFYYKGINYRDKVFRIKEKKVWKQTM